MSRGRKKQSSKQIDMWSYDEKVARADWARKKEYKKSRKRKKKR